MLNDLVFGFKSYIKTRKIVKTIQKQSRQQKGMFEENQGKEQDIIIYCRITKRDNVAKVRK